MLLAVFTALFLAWWSWQAVLNYSNISSKLLANNNILASLEAGRGKQLPFLRVWRINIEKKIKIKIKKEHSRTKRGDEGAITSL